MVGTLIRYEDVYGIVFDYWVELIGDGSSDVLCLKVYWSDQDYTEETFGSTDHWSESYGYYFYHNDRWLPISKNYYEFRQILEEK